MGVVKSKQRTRNNILAINEQRDWRLKNFKKSSLKRTQNCNPNYQYKSENQFFHTKNQSSKTISALLMLFPDCKTPLNRKCSFNLIFPTNSNDFLNQSTIIKVISEMKFHKGKLFLINFLKQHSNFGSV